MTARSCLIGLLLVGGIFKYTVQRPSTADDEEIAGQPQPDDDDPVRVFSDDDTTDV